LKLDGVWGYEIVNGLSNLDIRLPMLGTIFTERLHCQGRRYAREPPQGVEDTRHTVYTSRVGPSQIIGEGSAFPLLIDGSQGLELLPR
jgi:hypothetical protein